MGHVGSGGPEDARQASRLRLEASITDIWGEILGLGDVASDSDFFELGGDSLAAVRMLAAIEDLLLTPVDFTDFLDAPDVASLAALVQAARDDATLPVQPAPAPPADSPAAEGRAPLSFSQERLWFLHQLEGSTDAYNMPIGARLRGSIDAEALARSLQEVARRHAALRTTFASQNGHGVQVESPEPSFALRRADVRESADPEAEAQRLVDELTAVRLELEQGPLMVALLVQLSEQEYVLELVFHHIICDGWSQVVVLREIAALYEAFSRHEAPDLPAPRVQYPQHARAERERLVGPELADTVAPWLERLAGAPETLELPVDRARPQVPSYRGATHRVRLPAATAAAVRAFARATRATPVATLLAAYYTLLYRYSGQDDIVVGATTSGRDSPELEGGVGLFASTVALRCDLSGEPSFGELVRRARDTVMWAVAHERAPFDQVVARLGHQRDLSRHPVFQVFFAHVPEAPLALEGAEPYDARPATSRFDLTLFVEEERDEQLELAWEYSTDLFEAETIERFAQHYLRLLEAGLTDPERPIDELPMLGEAELAAVTEATGELPNYPVACMHALFEQRVAEAPEAIALSYDGSALSYADLNRRANRLAHHLRSLGAGPETLVALFLEPGLDLVTALLGVLKAGAAYVPLDPEYPGERAAFVLEDTAAPLLVTQQHLLERLPAHAARAVCLDRDAILSSPHLADDDPEPLATPANLAYVIYTSGSTGRPKGVQVEHRQVARLFSATDAWYGFGPSDTWVLLHSYAFDFSVWELWGALAYGGRLVISPLWTTRSPQGLAELVTRERVTIMNATPSLFAVIQEELLRVADELALRFVVFGGEALAPSGLRPWFEHFGDDGPTLVNMYGITETTVHVTYRPLAAADCERETSPIGVPIPDLSLHLLDPKGVPVPPGVAGELFVGGAGVARGYLNRSELTAERFISSPFGPGRLYRTGDVARRLPDGELDFRGRIDDQVKIRGFRIELGEVQAAVRDAPLVADAAVIAVDVSPGDTRLAAYVIPRAGSDDDDVRAVLTAHLKQRLPGYMVPASIITLHALPLTRNGKTDRKALPPPRWQTRSEAGFLAPQTPNEQLIAEIWCTVLGVERVGRDDNFFNLGGHSLLAARVATQVRERCVVDLSVRALFEQPELGAFAALVDAARPSASAAATSPEPAGAPPEPAAEVVRALAADAPLSYQQQSLLFFDALEPGSIIYNAALAVRIAGQLDPAALRDALQELVHRHEALRTVLVADEASARQVVLEDWSIELPVADLSALRPAERELELQRRLREYGRRPFDLAHDRLLRATLFRLGALGHVLLLQSHHIVLDAWAVEILYRELGELYEAARRRRPARLPELPMQYRDFAVWQREHLSGERLDRELDFWRAHLAGAPTILRLPTDKRRPAEQTFEGESHRITLSSDLAGAVRERCQAEQVTPYMLLLAAFATLLYRDSGQDDILFGGPMANRELPGLEHMIGFCANTIVVRAQLAGNPEFRDLLSGVRESVLASFEHQEIPLELVVDAVRPQRQPGINPLFQVNFRVRVGAAPVPALPGANTSLVPVDLGHARFDLALELHLLDDAIEAEFNYNTDVFEREPIERLATGFEALLRQALRAPETRLLSFERAEHPAPGSNGGGEAPGTTRIRGFRRGGGSASAR
jgi:amino acid adenylation domain-containing protein